MESFRKALPVVQHYAWGCVGESSMVAKLSALSNDSDIITDKPSAELWMGTHRNGPAKVVNDDNSTTPVQDYVGKPLPFLFKVLAVRTALSIQAHPDAKLAQELHKDRPEVYKDPFAKPEMAIALTPLTVMCAFRPIREITDFLATVPELRELLGEDECDCFVEATEKKGLDKEAFKGVFTKLMNADTNKAAQCAKRLTDRLAKEPESATSNKRQKTSPKTCEIVDVNEIVQLLQTQYPGDIGIFCPYFLNCLKTQPGSGFFLEPDVPHAYIAGNLLECMGPSDNVVRAGLTPKLRDTPVLCSMLTYECGLPPVLDGESVDKMTKLYQPPAPHNELNTFRLLVSRVPKGESVKISGLPTHAMLLVQEGTGTINKGDEAEKLNPGYLVLIMENSEVTLTNTGELDLVCASCYSSNYVPCGIRAAEQAKL